MKSKGFGIIFSGFAWPLLHYLLGVARFGTENPSTSYMQALLDFGLFGLFAGWLFFFFRERSANDKQRRFSLLGYLAATPFAFVGTLGGGLFLPGMLGAIVGGGLPLLIGTWLGKLLGGMGSAG